MNKMPRKVPKKKAVDNITLPTKRSKKSRTSKVLIQPVQETRSQNEHIEIKHIRPHTLSPECIVLRANSAERLLDAEGNLQVPPGSSRSDFIHNKNIDTIPLKVRDVIELNIPYVRVLGIKKTIDVLGEFFGCTLYRTSLLQFWFLDMVTDCLWKCQDEFMLSEKYQRDVLGWVLYFFDIIRDPLLNFSRGQFFRLLRQAMSLAEDRIECGDSYFPSPEDLFTINLLPEDPVEFDALISESDDSSLSSDDSASERSFLVMPSEEYPDISDFYELPAKECGCAISLSSSLETLSEKSIHIENQIQPPDDDLQQEFQVSGNDPVISYSVSEFYQPDSNTHSRFIDEIGADHEEPIVADKLNIEDSSEAEYEWVNESKKIPSRSLEKPKSATIILDAGSIHSNVKKGRNYIPNPKIKPERAGTQEDTVSIQSLTQTKSKGKIPSKSQQENKLDETELLKAWHDYNIWEQRKKDMADPDKGWKPNEPEVCSDDSFCSQIERRSEDSENEEYIKIKNEWLQYLSKHKLAIDQTRHNVFVNSCLLLIVKQFILEYFYESFQYKLVKISYQTVPNLIYEKLNNEWHIPKQNRDEFTRPFEKKTKPPKLVKEKPSKHKNNKKKEKFDKKSKSSKGTIAKEKKLKVKPEKLRKARKTKEDKEEFERVNMEEELRIREEKDAEENKRFLFPLGLAADEQFFKNIFDDYISPSAHQSKYKNNKEKN